MSDAPHHIRLRRHEPGDGHECLHMLWEIRPDIVLLDIVIGRRLTEKLE